MAGAEAGAAGNVQSITSEQNAEQRQRCARARNQNPPFFFFKTGNLPRPHIFGSGVNRQTPYFSHLRPRIENRWL